MKDMSSCSRTGKAVPVDAMKADRDSGNDNQLHAPATLPQVQQPGTHWTGGSVSATAVQTLWRTKLSCPCWNPNPWMHQTNVSCVGRCAYLWLHRRGFQITNFTTLHNSVTLVADPEYVHIDMDKWKCDGSWTLSNQHTAGLWAISVAFLELHNKRQWGIVGQLKTVR
jgi:hypothetical protein